MVDVVKQNGDHKGSFGAEGGTKQPRREAEGRGARGAQPPPSARRADAASGEPKEEVRPRRRRLTAAKKFEIFIECSTPGAPIGEILRREGLYSSDLARIREQVREGALDRLKQGPGRKKKTLAPEEVDRMAKELREKEQALAALTVEYMALKKEESRASKAR
jgi:transposase-like protein